MTGSHICLGANDGESKFRGVIGDYDNGSDVQGRFPSLSLSSAFIFSSSSLHQTNSDVIANYQMP